MVEFLQSAKPKNIVLDPIVRSTSGADLVDAKGTQQMREKLLKLADVITPNIEEAAALTGNECYDYGGDAIRCHATA